MSSPMVNKITGVLLAAGVVLFGIAYLGKELITNRYPRGLSPRPGMGADDPPYGDPVRNARYDRART